MENKNEICKLLLPALQATRYGSDIVESKSNPVFGVDYADNYCLIGDGKFFAVMHKDEMFLSFTLKNVCHSLRKFKDEFARYDYKLAKMSYQIDAIPARSSKKISCRRVVSDDCAAFVQNKYIRYFDKEASYYIYSAKALVFVLENDVMVGAICPVNIREEDIIV